mmetsp:Transcript_11536/g.33973  ORF Transcript_11536/g.33973 Transcript_11536/m.33973 type:complete len:239 (+) Transcript_11536:423-1139(+)
MRRCVTRNSRSPHVSEDEDVGENNNQYRNARSSPRRNARKSCDGRSYYKRTKPCRSATKNLFRVARSTRRRSGPPRRVDERRPPRKLLKPHPMNCSSTRRAKASRRDGPSLSPSRRRRSPSCSRCIPRCAGRTRRTCPRTCPRPSFGSSTSNRDIFGATRGGRCSRRARPRPTLLMIYLPDMKNRATTRCRSRPRCGRPWICRGRTRIDLYLLPKRMLWIPRRRLLPGYCGSLIGMRR